MQTKQKGDVALGKAISYFLSNDYEVCLPIGDKRDYDLIVAYVLPWNDDIIGKSVICIEATKYSSFEVMQGLWSGQTRQTVNLLA